MRPQAGPGQVQIKVAACGIGYVDVLVALGGYQVKPALPHTPGQEIAGWVSAIGSGVEGLSTGDRVLAAAQGGFAEYAVASRDGVFRIPDNLAFASAASLRLNYLTALQGCATRANLQERAPGRAGRGRRRRHRRRAGRQGSGRRGDSRGLDRGEAGLREPRAPIGFSTAPSKAGASG